VRIPAETIRQYKAMISSRLGWLRARCSREEWNLGVVRQSAEDIVQHGLTAPIRWLPQRGPWHVLADPACLVRRDGTRIIFAEHLDNWVGRGEIWAACVRGSDDLAQAVFRPWMRSSGHLSYPFPFHDQAGGLFFMAETWEAGALHLWRETNDRLRHVGPLIERPVIDATPWYDGSGWWLFCTLRDDGPNECLHLFHATNPEGPWIAHPANPVKRDPGSSRPAGPLFRADGKLIRPAQDCAQTYGGAVVLNEVIRLDQEGFHEVPLRRLEPDKVYPHGLHTFCPAGDETIIDGKRWAFRAMDIPRKVVEGVQNRIRPLRRTVLPLDMVLPGCRTVLPSVVRIARE
jgi:hypothetical protein